MYVFALLTMAVKEDAPVYILFFGLYLLLSNKSKRHGTSLCVLSCAYFAIVTSLMEKHGLGIMSYRYDNFIFAADGSLYSVILNIFKNPAYLFAQILSPEKLTFLILMVVPMALLPFAIKKPSAIVLLGPLLLMNLMTDYKYQFDIGFQYTYGSAAFLFYLSVMNLAALKKEYAKKLLLSGVCASLVFFTSVNMPRWNTYIRDYNNRRAVSDTINEALAVIPKDVSIKAGTFLVPALWDRKEVYSSDYYEGDTDYIVFDLRFGSKEYNTFIKRDTDYEPVLFQNNIIAIYKRK